MTKHVLITGAAGFIGFHLAQRLKERGEHIVGLDNFNTYYDPALKRARAEELKKLGIKVIEGDICDFDRLHHLVKQHQITHIVHLAAQAGVRYSLHNPHVYLKTNIDGFFNILEVCRIHTSLQLIYASSSSVYGLNKKMPFSVDDRTDHQASVYGVTKKTNELLAHTYHHLFGIHTTGLRFFTVYGPWGRPDMAYFSFTKAILEEQPIDLYHHGSLLRDFTYIDDIIDGLVAALDRRGSCELFNLGHHHQEPVSHLVALIEKNLGKKAQKRMLPMQPGDVMSTYADIKESQQELGFEPKVSLEEGIERFIAWYKSYYIK